MSYLVHDFDRAALRRVYVSSVSELKSALNESGPGDYIELADGNYDLGSYRMVRHGSSIAPIVIGAEHLFGARLSSHSILTVSGQHIYVTDIDFKQAQLVLSHNSTGGNCRVSRCRFTGGIHRDGSLVIQHSSQNRIDQCEISDPLYRGMMLKADRMSDVSAIRYGGMSHNWIERCWFHDHLHREDIIGGETLSIGHSSEGLQPFQTLVENCVFSECYGSHNPVVIRSSYNIIMNCLFKNDRVPPGRRPASLIIRASRNTRIENCDFEGYQSIIVSGDNHLIQENNLVSLAGPDAKGHSFSNIEIRTGNVYIEPGIWLMGRRETGNHPTTRNCIIANNRVEGTVQLGVVGPWADDQGSRHLLPVENTEVYGSGPLEFVGRVKGWPEPWYEPAGADWEPNTDLYDPEPDEEVYPYPEPDDI